MNPGPILGKRALVTGASSGLGADLARELALCGADLILVARRTDRLETLAAELRLANRVQVDVIPADLSLPNAAQKLYDSVTSTAKSVDVLINDAGLGLYGLAREIPWQKEQAMLQVDVVSLAGLTKLFLPQMLERRFGYILNVASVVAYQPTPRYASYAAAKRYVLDYSLALNYELRGSGVSVTVLSAPVMSTEFYEVSLQRLTAYQRFVMMTSADTARIAIEAMLAGKRNIVPGLVNALQAFVSTYSPQSLSTRVAARAMKSNTPAH